MMTALLGACRASFLRWRPQLLRGDWFKQDESFIDDRTSMGKGC